MSESKYYTMSSTDTVPESTALTGTISIVQDALAVTATGGAFLSEVQINDYLYDVTNGEVRRVTRVYDDNKVAIDRPFGNDSTSVKVVRRPRVNYLSVTAQSGTDATMDGEPLYQNLPVTKGSQDARTTTSPVVIDIGTSTVVILYQLVG